MSKLKKQSVNPKYTTRLLKAGALLDEMRILIRNWEDLQSKKSQDRLILVENILDKPSRSRARDIFSSAFVPRFLKGQPKEAWKILRVLEAQNVAINILRPIYYWITVRNEPILYDFICEELSKIKQTGKEFITVYEVVVWLKNKLLSYKITWSESVILGIARKILAILRDFHLLQGRVNKKLTSFYLPLEAFVYIAFILSKQGFSGYKLVCHPDWRLFLLPLDAVERKFLEADRHGFLNYLAAGKIARIEFSASTYEEMANVISQ